MNYKLLSDYADIIVGFPFPSKSFNVNGQGVRLVRGKNVSKRSLRWGSETRWWNDTDGFEKYLLREGDILVGMDGSRVGKNYVQIHEKDLPLLLVQRVACIRAKKNVDSWFLWNCIANESFEKYVDLVKTGSAIPHISSQQIGSFLIPSFDYPSQITIGNMLGSIEKLIENNNKLNENLAA